MGADQLRVNRLQVKIVGQESPAHTTPVLPAFFRRGLSLRPSRQFFAPFAVKGLTWTAIIQES